MADNGKGNPYRCVKNHFCKEEYNNKNCPHDKKSVNDSRREELIKKYSSDPGVNLNNNYEIDNEEYRALKTHYDWAIDNGVVSAFISFNHYKSISKRVKEIAINKIAVDGTRIKHVTFHCVDRICGTTEKENGVKHEGINLNDFEFTLFNGEIHKDSDTNTIIFMSDKCRIAINPQNGTVKQCNKL